jgi:hypothetical protein
VKESTLNFRVITTLFKNYGTRVSTDQSDYLYDFVKHGRDDANVYIEAREKTNSMMKEGHPVRFYSESYLHLIMNKEMTHVEKFVIAFKSISILDPALASFSAIIDGPDFSSASNSALNPIMKSSSSDLLPITFNVLSSEHNFSSDISMSSFPDMVQTNTVLSDISQPSVQSSAILNSSSSSPSPYPPSSTSSSKL